MKKLILLAVILTMGTMTGCNRNVIDTMYKFDKAQIELQNGEIVEGKVESWIDFPDGDQIQVKINGKTYLVHSSNITLISE